MITFITGTNGAGKTAWLVQELTRLPSQRKVYQHGIPGLKVAHEPIFCKSPDCEYCQSLIVTGEGGSYLKADFDHAMVDEEGNIVMPPNVLFIEDWPDWATDGSLIVVDECQRPWRASNQSNVPIGIKRLETHRHKGLDFWLISQSPKLLHTNIRELVGRHIHLVANWRGRNEYEWPEVQDNVRSRGDAIIRPYKLPKPVFKLYHSASLHTKLVKRKPLAYYAFLASLAVLAIIGYRFSLKMADVFGDSNPEAQAASAPAPIAAGAPQATQGAGGVQAAKSFSNEQRGDFPDFTPTVEGRPESAPAYAQLLKVTAVPVLAGCIKSANTCKCYTQQATPYPATWDQCLEHVMNLKFNPFVTPRTGNSAPIPRPSGDSPRDAGSQPRIVPTTSLTNDQAGSPVQSAELIDEPASDS